MTDKEKAKAYDEAIKRAKQLYVDGMPQISRNTTEYIFPELKESEDERIKEAIIATIHLYYGEPLEDEAKEMLAWLEKQGEKKPALREEDEQHIDSLLKRLDGLCRNEFERTRFAINEDEDWLKSLKVRI
jgi:hypothetical protein